MKTKKLFILTAIILVSYSGLWAQQGSLKLNLNYTVGIPTGSFKNVTDKVSPRGWEASVLYGINDQLSVGLVTGFQDFYQKFDRRTIHQSGYDLSAVVSNSIQTTPLMAKVKYRFSPAKMVQPYVAVAAGANFVNFKTYYGEFADSYSKIRFAAQPELGINIPVGASKRTAINFSAGYDIMPYNTNNTDNLNHVTVKGGVIISIR